MFTVIYSQLDPTEEGAKETHHAQEFNPTQVLHNELLTYIGNAVECRPRKDQKIPHEFMITCMKRR